MVRITFIEPGGTEHIVDAPLGRSVMNIAADNLIPGIVGDCGGCMSCATCHGYIEGPLLSKLHPKSNDEIMMLDGVFEVKETSRLTCQIVMRSELDGLVVRLPENQY